MTTEQAFKQWCKETGRSGSVITGKSLKEFFDYYQPILKQEKLYLLKEYKFYILRQINNPICYEPDRDHEFFLIDKTLVLDTKFPDLK